MKICRNFLKTALIMVIFLPIFVNGQIIITEIMYDLAEGSDTGREWVEIFNSGEQIDLTGWKFFDGSNHILNEPPKNGGRGSLILKPSEYAVLSGNADLFISENSSYKGTVIDTVMSLKNTSGEIALFDKENNQIDRVLYNKEMGASGDGNTLQKINSGWKAGSPTLGTSDFVFQTTPITTIAVATTTSQTTQQQNLTLPGFKPQIFAYAGEDRAVIVGADTIFEAKAVGLNDEPIGNALFTWNFGDGSFKKGKKIMHSYNYPGNYVVFLEASSGEYSVTDRINVIALPADIVISSVGRDADKNFIELHNKTDRELNLSWWRLQVDNNFFTLQKNTVILPNEKVIFSKNVTNLNITNQSGINLLYPNGSIATVFNENSSTAFYSVVSKNNVIENPTQKSSSDIKSQIPIIKSLDIEQENSNEDKLSASVINSDIIENTAQNKGILKWIIGLSSVILLSIIGYIFVRKDPNTEDMEDKQKDETEKIANEIEIIESPH